MDLKKNYRPDIDGLRAVAVLAVLFYHTDIAFFSGGYVGVDVFFVISGYLITGIIVREIEANEFSILKFYERRIRRIYPALYAVIAFVFLVSAILYTPYNFKETGKSAMATIVFASNILFWYQSGYFDAPSTLKPMLHTWSLAVEEQFYIVLPLLIWLVMRFARTWLKPILIMLAALSFGLSVYYIKADVTAAFYFAHLRAWELLIGSLLAVNILPIPTNHNIRHALSLAGIFMIASSVSLYTHATLFPGTSALLPTMGAALILYSGMGGKSLVGNFLQTPVFVFIGKISYSLYLWHWVIIVFGKLYIITPATSADKVIWIAVSFALAVLSWKFIETPFRTNIYFSRPKIFALAGSVMAVAFAVSAAIYITDGAPQRFDQQSLSLISMSDVEWEKWDKCIKRAKFTKTSNLCQVGDTTIPPQFLLWGDSHAHMFAATINTVALEKNTSGYVASLNSCPPLVGVERPDRPGCLKYNDKVFAYIQEHPELKTVILSARWGWVAHGTGYKLEGDSFELVDDTIQINKRDGNIEVFEAGLERTVQNLISLNRDVILIMPTPEVGFDVPSAYLIAARTSRDINALIAPTYKEYLERNQVVFDIVEDLAERYKIQLIDPSKILCDANICRVAIEGQPPLYRDYNHLSTLGVYYVLGAFEGLFNE